MKQTRCLSVLLLLLVSATLFSLPAFSQYVAGQPSATEEIQTVTYSGKSYYRYTVKPKETIYSLTKRFGVEEAELVANNPFLKKGLQIGQVLLIPVKEGVTVMPVVENQPVTETLPRVEETVVLNENPLMDQAFEKKHVTSFALLLPLMLGDTADVSNLRYVEYYEGMLLAADTLRRRGVSIDIAVYDIGKTLYSMNRVLQHESFDNVDYIIAAANNAQMPELSKWASLHSKKLILPFSSRIPETASNPFIYQVNPPREMSYKQLLSMDISAFRGKNILLLRTPKEENDERQQLFDGIKSRLQQYNIPFRELTDAGLKVDDGHTYKEVLEPALSSELVNLIIPAPISLTESNRIISLVGAAANAVDKCKVELYGYPEWIALNKSNLPLLYKMHTQIYGNYFVDFTLPSVRRFEIRYSETFGKDVMNTFPRYAMMGYDVTLYFTGMRLNFDFGIAPLQHQMHFVQTSPDSGWYNNNVYRIQYHPNRTVSAEILAQ